MHQGGFAVALLAVASFSVAAVAAENPEILPDWARPSAAPDLPETMAQPVTAADNAARAVAFPSVPLTAPLIVREGNDGDGICQGCHTTTGMGGPQSAPLAGLPPAYFIRQMANFVSDARGQAYRPNMADFAKAMTLEEIVESAEYYASLRFEPWVEVVEAETIPRTYVGPRDIRALHPDGGEEPLGERIVEIAKTPDAPYMRGSAAYTAYVPPGSLVQGNELAMRGGGKTIACSMCHGADLNGQGDVPPIAGRSPTHTARQMLEYRDGLRGGASAAPMLPVVENLSDSDIIAISAYVASLPPM